ncbi:hypothetical protein F4802DRAFT_540336 [Xylaria palmicola]|nr:hypothetical protein F4802DRAFT_540336 [Xylaria palmicola]
MASASSEPHLSSRLSDTTDAPAVPDAADVADAGPSPRAPDSPTRAAPPSGRAPNTRRCFVCLVDEPEATLPADWAMPCSCSLEGHQECLLAWVADLEAQVKEVQCPVCKSPVHVAEPYDPAIRLSNYLHRQFSLWSPRLLLLLVGSGVIVSSSVYGARALSCFAGPGAVRALLATDNDDDSPSLFQLLMYPRSKKSVSLLNLAALPLIAPGLILNRMNVADVVTIPVSLGYATVFSDTSELLTWPPSPTHVMALYGVLKSTYYQVYNVVSKSLQRSWAAHARAIGAGSGSQVVPDFDPVPEPAAAMDFLELEIDILIGEENDEPPANNNNNNNNNNGAGRRNGAVGAAGRSPLNFIAGALLWPGVSYGMGELMRRLLPSRLVSRPQHGPATGLLQERWGRSFVGGCLFVVLKDVFFLYVKYRRMMNQSQRRIKNSDRRNIRN